MALGLLLLRLCVGLTIAAHGSQKLFGWFGGHGIEATGGFFESAFGFKPGRIHATMAGLSELVGGLLLVVGFLTPFGAAMVVGVMIVATVTAHSAKGFFLTDGGFEYNLLIGVAALTLAFTGPGAVSIDHPLYGGALSGAIWGIAALVLGAVAAVATLSGRQQLDAEPAAAPAAQQAPADPQPTVVMSRSTDERVAAREQIRHPDTSR